MPANALFEITNRREKTAIDPYVSSILKFVFTGSRGGITRMTLVLVLRKRPLNANCLANTLGLDYKSILYELNVLEKNNLIRKISKMYGSAYSISTFLEANYEIFDRMVQDYIEKGEHKELKKCRPTIMALLKREIASAKSYATGERIKIECASCRCSLEECRECASSGKCTNCSLKKCCCLPFVIDSVCI